MTGCDGARFILKKCHFWVPCATGTRKWEHQFQVLPQNSPLVGEFWTLRQGVGGGSTSMQLDYFFWGLVPLVPMNRVLLVIPAPPPGVKMESCIFIQNMEKATTSAHAPPRAHACVQDCTTLHSSKQKMGRSPPAKGHKHFRAYLGSREVYRRDRGCTRDYKIREAGTRASPCIRCRRQRVCRVGAGGRPTPRPCRPTLRVKI